MDTQEYKLLDIGMIASVLAYNMWDEIYNWVSGGSMDAHEIISKWAIEFNEKFEGKFNWGEGDYKSIGFEKSECWDEAVMEFAEQKMNQ